MSPAPLFIPDHDLTNPYISANLSGLSYVNLSAPLHVPDATYFSTRTFFVSKRITGPFATDLTLRDDVLLAFLSMFLVLVIEGALATLLLRTRRGHVTASGFATKYLVEMARDFNFFHFHRTRKANRSGKHQKGPRFMLALVAISALLFTFGLEVLVLFLTARKQTPVTNAIVSLRIQVPIVPHWNVVRYAARASINQPCQSLSVIGAARGKTSITACVIATFSPRLETVFHKPEDNVTLEIVADVHSYGAEYFVSIANLSASYSAKAVYTLDDRKPRLMAQRLREADEKKEMRLIQLQFIAYLATVYLRNIESSTANFKRTLQLLNTLRPEFNAMEGKQIEVLRIRGKPLLIPSKRYSTRVTGPIPHGPMVLHFAQQFFRCSGAIFVSGPDETDLFEKEGIKRVRSVVWTETSRELNWLSLTVILLLAIIILSAMRHKLRPQTTADLAAILVKNAVGADSARSPVELIDEQEDTYFRIAPADNQAAYFKTAPIPGEGFYSYGAETKDGWDWTDIEYESTDDMTRVSQSDSNTASF